MKNPHLRLNILTGEWVLNSPQRLLRPWQGKEEKSTTKIVDYDDKCYLCPGNLRANGEKNPHYQTTFSFDNDYPALLYNNDESIENSNQLFQTKKATGICRVVCFSPSHSKTLANLSVDEAFAVCQKWQEEYRDLALKADINYIQIFENKGEIMGCSNPHPHGQIWASNYIPNEIAKETNQQQKYFNEHKKTLLSDYLKQELEQAERVIWQNDDFAIVVPFWAVWPFETLIISKKAHINILQFSSAELKSLSQTLITLTSAYDKIFNISFPYSAGMHQAPIVKELQLGWHWHMHFYPPLLRSATIKKFMVGYEMLAGPQRDITPEQVSILIKGIINNK